MLEAVNRKIIKKALERQFRSSTASGIKSGTYVPVSWHKVSTDPGVAVFFPWSWLLNFVGFYVEHQNYIRWGIRGRSSPSVKGQRFGQDFRESTKHPLTTIISHIKCNWMWLNRQGWTNRDGDPQKDPRALYTSLWYGSVCKAKARDASGWNLKSGKFISV